MSVRATRTFVAFSIVIGIDIGIHIAVGSSSTIDTENEPLTIDVGAIHIPIRIVVSSVLALDS